MAVLGCERRMRAGRQLEREEVMRKILAALLCCWCSHALAQTAQELIDNPKNSENVTTFGMGYHLNQYSPLNQINKSNVKRLVPIWTTSLSNDAGEMTQPGIYNGIMYVVNGPQDRRAGLALSIHAKRKFRSGRQRRTGDRRSEHRRPSTKGAHERQQERLPLPNRPHQRRPDHRSSVCEGQLGEPY